VYDPRYLRRGEPLGFGAPLEFAEIWKRTPKIVFSTTLGEVGPNARLATWLLGQTCASFAQG
jgi:hypothetical protein